MGAYFLKKQARSPILEGFGRNIYALLSFSGQQYKKIEVRSSFPRNGIEFAICHPSYEFDVIGPYSNNYKPGEIQKDYYVRTLFHLYNPTDIISMISADSFKVYLTGGATWDMMIDTDYSKNKTLLPDFGLGVIQKASYRVVPFSKSKDTREIKRVIIEDQQVKN